MGPFTRESKNSNASRPGLSGSSSASANAHTHARHMSQTDWPWKTTPTHITEQFGLQIVFGDGLWAMVLQQHPLRAACITRSRAEHSMHACVYDLTKQRRKANSVKRTATLSTCHVCLYVCVYMSIYVYNVYMYICPYLYVCSHVYMSTMYIRLYVYVSICKYMLEQCSASTQAHTCNAQVPEPLGRTHINCNLTSGLRYNSATTAHLILLKYVSTQAH